MPPTSLRLAWGCELRDLGAESCQVYSRYRLACCQWSKRLRFTWDALHTLGIL